MERIAEYFAMTALAVVVSAAVTVYDWSGKGDRLAAPIGTTLEADVQNVESEQTSYVTRGVRIPASYVREFHI